ncbi:MAG: bifunctional 4-hydroxy-2-oxoglutarate aldolase/2-dehydro-3-deoxy-phosphogluconate aldolase [Verrucomicrobia bacterium]|jgi:2-dehydro-3-deoxyphosphogluconate aldolase/(4S)-4-hydroxy-2-oxoglutarate aldolase|nr:bifunctional 4-hydroxy-2-oxoglutarate aldolase/2-dehydro-3-deoxy-phosphogluconate aldolase [Verrucomicrobiota bacterium]
MKQPAFNETTFWEMPLVVIMRGFPLDSVAPIVQAISKGGLSQLEITMNTDGATEQIRHAIQAAGGTSMQIGAGTVTTCERFHQAVEAGANFIVTPNFNEQVIRCCQESRIPFIPGAMSPTEVYRAYESGALAAKIFPADTLGAGYIKSIKAPMPEVRVAPTGGVSVERMVEYLNAGADAFGLGTPLFPAEAVKQGDWTAIEAAARSFHDAYVKWKEGNAPG